MASTRAAEVSFLFPRARRNHNVLRRTGLYCTAPPCPAPSCPAPNRPAPCCTALHCSGPVCHALRKPENHYHKRITTTCQESPGCSLFSNKAETGSGGDLQPLSSAPRPPASAAAAGQVGDRRFRPLWAAAAAAW